MWWSIWRLLITEPLHSITITVTSSLLRILPHLCSTSLLSSLSFLRFDFSLYIRAQTSPVPCKSLYQDPAIFTPTAIWTVIRFLSDLSRVVKNTRFRLYLRNNDASSIVHFHSTSWYALDWFISLFLLRSIPQLLTAAPTGCLKPEPKCRFREAYTHPLESMIYSIYSPFIFRTDFNAKK